MDLRRLQVFAKVYERRSFSRAAEDVFLSQPTVSGHIKTLEDELGIKLFDRLGRDILPTRGAEILYDYAARVLDLVDEAQAAVDAFWGRLRGELKLGGSTIPGNYVLPALVGDYRLLHPEVRVVLQISGTQHVADLVLAGELELAMVGARLDEDRLAFNPIMEDEVCLAAPPGHELAGREISLGELAAYPIIMRESGSGTMMFITEALRQAGGDISRLDVAAQMGSTMAVIQGVRSGVGMGFVSRRAIEDELEYGKLVEVKVARLALKRDFYLVSRRERTHSPAAQAFLAMCLANLGQVRQA